MTRHNGALATTTPVTTITGRSHEVQVVAGPDQCPVCLAPGIAVPPAVLKSMLKRDLREHARDGYRLCTGGNCPVAYFDNDAGTLIDAADLNKPITLKDPGPDVPVCYCLNVSRGTILAGIAGGTILSSDDAKRETRACTGKACHIVNPGGICCGDQLRDTVAAGLAAVGADPAVLQAARAEDPGATCCGRTFDKVLAGDAADACSLDSADGPTCHC